MGADQMRTVGVHVADDRMDFSCFEVSRRVVGVATAPVRLEAPTEDGSKPHVRAPVLGGGSFPFGLLPETEANFEALRPLPFRNLRGSPVVSSQANRQFGEVFNE